MEKLAIGEENETRLKTSAHTPLLYLLIPIIAGFSIAHGALPEPPKWILLFAAFACVGVAIWSFKWLQSAQRLMLWSIPFSLGVVLFAWLYYALRIPPPPDLSKQANREAFVTLEVQRLFAYQPESRNFGGLAKLVTAPTYRPDLKGQTVFFNCRKADDWKSVGKKSQFKIRGKLEPTPLGTEGFDAYLVQQGAYLKITQGDLLSVTQETPRFYRWFKGINLQWQETLQHGASTPETQNLAGIATAMLLGEKAALEPKTKERFILSGTMHLFAVSGLHVGIVAGFLFIVISALQIPAPARPWIGLVLLLAYVYITGAAPSAVRAWWMAAFFWSANAFLRKPAPFSALCASAIVVLLIDPRQLFAAGFQLSYTVVAGLLLFGIPLQDWLKHRIDPWKWIPENSLGWPQKVLRSSLHFSLGMFAISFTASMFSMPLTIRYFRILAPGAFLLNIPLVLIAPLAMTASLFGVIAGSLGFTGLAVFANRASWVFIRCMDWLVEVFTRVPQSSLSVSWRWDGFGYLLATAMLAAGIMLGDKRVRPLLRFGGPIAILLMSLLLITQISTNAQ
ncbi:MAG: ComEC/Rec2 family competence protein [Verrucomicrobiota bacterium]